MRGRERREKRREEVADRSNVEVEGSVVPLL
jgi:hypothetical protein